MQLLKKKIVPKLEGKKKKDEWHADYLTDLSSSKEKARTSVQPTLPRIIRHEIISLQSLIYDLRKKKGKNSIETVHLKVH